MKRIRINNDFTFAWAIERNGLPEDLSAAINMVLQARNSAGAIQVITDYEVAANMVSVEITPEIANVLGRYVFILTYELPDASLDDMERLCEIDTDAFILVPRTAEADDSTDLLVTSDMAIGFKGDSAYQVWLDAGNTGTEADYLASLKGDTGNYGVVEFVVNENMELEQHTLVGDPLDFEIVDGDLVLNEQGQTVNLGTVAIKDTYSYDEQRIGTWVNGKPIYRKVILLESPTLPDTSIIIQHAFSTDVYTRMDVISNISSFAMIPIGNLNTGNIAGLLIGTLDVTEDAIYLNEIEFQHGNEFTYHLILEYTKL